MPFRFRCTGRVFPNGPAISRVGCDRRSPMVVQVMWLQGSQPAYSEQSGVWLNAYFSGIETFGLNPVTNWNVDNAETPGVHVNVRIQYTTAGDGAFELDVLIGNGMSAPEQLYTEGFVPWVHWEDFLDFRTLPYVPGVEPPGPYILDEVVSVRIGTYARIPANTCQL